MAQGKLILNRSMIVKKVSIWDLAQMECGE
jgi:hypothetical protein